MNTGPECLETRMEVQFFDKYDLLGQGNKKAITIDKGASRIKYMCICSFV